MRLMQFIMVALTAAIAASCSNADIPQKLNSFVDSAELNCDNYDARDWQKSIVQYQELVEKYNNSGKVYSESERQMAARAMGRYHSLLLQNGLKASASYLEELKSVIPSYLDGLSDGLEENAGDLMKSLEGIIDNEELEKAFEGLGEKLENIFGSLGEE